MIQTVQNILIGVQVWPFAIAGAFVALIGALVGSHEVMELGKSAAGFGAMGFMAGSSF